ncbi:serine hydrolase [Microbacterium sp. B2969]|uniref:Serine hydrolase n=1 Tax=Microbacterium alkaliflavum TaxID=3248839 RepID=A0ABW7QED0_9MICO
MNAVVRRRAGLSVVVVAVLALTACTFPAGPTPSSSASSAPVDENPGVDSLSHVTAESVEKAIADLPASVKAAMDATGTPGIAVGVVYDDELRFAKGYGVRDVDSGDPVDPETVFAIASVSKSVGMTVVARAIDDGVVAWDTPVADNLAGFALSDPYVGSHVTIGDMYAHRSGLYEHAGDELEEIGYDRATIIERMRYIPLEPFRTTYHYGNFDITTAAESVAQAAHEDWADLSDRLIYEPLGMDSTSSRFSDLEERDDRALGHVEVDGEWIVNPEQRQPDEQSPAGGVSSNVEDLAVWMRMLLNEGQVDGAEFIDPATLLPAMSPQSVSAPAPVLGSRSGFYGYGFNVSTTAGGMVDVNHSGAFALGTGTIVKMLPAAGLGIIVLANASANGVVEGIAGRFMDIAQFGRERRDWLDLFTGVFAKMNVPSGELVGQKGPSAPEPARPLADYTGEYVNDYFGPATVSLAGDALELRLGPAGRWPLEHWDGDVFVFRPQSENALPGSISKATFDGDRLVLEYFDKEHLGTFVHRG